MQQFGAKLERSRSRQRSKLADGGKALGEAGTAKLLSGAGRAGQRYSAAVADGSKQLAVTAQASSRDGLDELKAGSGELATKLGDAASRRRIRCERDRCAWYQMFAQPVIRLKTTRSSEPGTELRNRICTLLPVPRVCSSAH
jgi:putative membrane protein